MSALATLKRFHLHLVSDSTGETLESVAKATLVQFGDVEAVKHFWPMVRTANQMDRIADQILEKPGPVLYTLVNEEIRDVLVKRCSARQVPTISVLDPVITALGTYLGAKAQNRPGRQHEMDAAYFARIDAVHYTLAHDDGQLGDNIEDADIVLVGISRTSKTPTSIYLANRGLKTANIPLVPNASVPESLKRLLSLENPPFVVGLTASPDRLAQVRQNRMRSLNEGRGTDYIDLDAIKAEIKYARRLCMEHDWPVIDVTRRSIEETAAAILNHYNQREMVNGGAPLRPSDSI